MVVSDDLVDYKGGFGGSTNRQPANRHLWLAVVIEIDKPVITGSLHTCRIDQFDRYEIHKPNASVVAWIKRSASSQQNRLWLFLPMRVCPVEEIPDRVWRMHAVGEFVIDVININYADLIALILTHVCESLNA